MEKPKNIVPNYDLLAKYFAGEASIAQINEIEKWVDQSPKHKRTFDSMYYLWIQSGHKKFDEKVNVSESWTKMKFRINAAKESKTEPAEAINPFMRSSNRLLKLAAIIVLGIGIAAVIKYLNSGPQFISKEALQVAIELKLPDNSEIKLNKKSKISYSDEFRGNKRLVKLQGEAYFDVKPNKEKPFVIETEFSQIRVTGTSFNVQAYDSSDIVEVTVVTGTVELSGKTEGSEKIILKKGEKGIIEKSKGKPVKKERIQENELFWATRTLIFKDTELYIAAETISKAYDVKIEILNEEIKYCRLDVVFSDANIEEIMEILRVTFDLNLEKTDNYYKLNGTHCK